MIEFGKDGCRKKQYDVQNARKRETGDKNGGKVEIVGILFLDKGGVQATLYKYVCQSDKDGHDCH